MVNTLSLLKPSRIYNTLCKGLVVSVDGLKLDKLKEKLELLRVDGSLSCTHLNDLLQKVAFQEATNEEVSVQLLDKVFHESLVDTDTDDESSIQSGEESKIKSADAKLGSLDIIKRKARQNSKLNRSRYPGRAANKETYKPLNNYLSRWPDPISNIGQPASHASTNVDKLSTQSFCHQLTSDSFLISESGITDIPGSTTCCCIALRDKHGYVKKFIFHNGENLLAPSMRYKAHELGYDVIQAKQSHAEAQCMQFLLHRHQKRSGWYTHILGIGCSRPHCIECDPLLKLYLGKGYDQFTSSIHTKSKQEGDMESDLPDTIKTHVCQITIGTHDTGGLVVNKHIERIGVVVNGQNAIDGSKYGKFYLPMTLKDSLQEKLNASISFDEERFTKNKKRIQKNP